MADRECRRTTLTTTRATYAGALDALRAQLCIEDESARSADGMPFQSLAEPPRARILDAAGRVPRTPAILWDLDALDQRVEEFGRLVGEHDLALSVAVKACRTVAILARLAGAGLGADVASPAELQVARRAGFRRISATGPGFREEHAVGLSKEGVLFDAQSLTQLGHLLRNDLLDAVGLRLRVPLPDTLRSATSRGGDSRFGVVVDHNLLETLAAAPATVTRIRVHTGESTARTLEFRARFALLAADLFGSVEEVNLGGGFLRLSRDPSGLRSALGTLRTVVRERRDLRWWIEPGAALLLDSAYLVTEVLDVHPDAVTVDASAWNIAPWTFPSFYTARGGSRRYAGTVYGPTLYEKDRFRQDTGAVAGEPRPAIGDRLVGTSFGAYTVANGRCFAGLALPVQYGVTARELEVIDA